MRPFAWLFLCALALMIILTPGCTDPTEIGGDLLSGDQAEVGFSDTLTLQATTILSDSVLTYFPANDFSDLFSSYPIGELADPILGTSKAELYAQLTLTSFSPNFENFIVDSVVLVLPLDTTNAYGNLKEPFGLAVHRLTEDINPLQNYFSNRTFQSEMMPLATHSFTPTFDSVTIVNYTDFAADTLRVPPQLRIPLSTRLGGELLGLDTAFYRSDSAFLSHFKGIHIKPTTVNAGMLSLNLVSSERAGLFIYYNNGSGETTAQYQYAFNPFYARVINLEYDATEAPAERYIENKALGDSLVFVQGMTGLNTKLEIPFINDFKNVVINKAELEVRVAKLPGDDFNIYTPVSQIMLLHPDEDGNLRVIDDIQILRAQGEATLRAVYGGVPIGDANQDDPIVYRMNLTSHFQGIIDGRNSNTLHMSVFNRAQRAARVPLYGTKHPEYAIKLKIAFTRL